MGEEGFEFGGGSLAELVVGGALGWAEGDFEDLFDEGGQFGKEVGFFAAEKEGAEAAAKALPQGVLLVGDYGGGGGILEGALEGFGEVFVGAKIAGEKELEEGPNVGEGVFQGGAGEGDADAGGETAGGAGVLAARVFDVLGFVEDDGLPGDGGEGRGIAAEDAVAGDDEAGRGEVAEGF